MLPAKQIQQTKQDILQWFYEQAKEYQLTGTAQRLWYWLFTQLSMVQPDRFYEISSRTLADELGVCLKSIERSRKILQQSGLLHYEVRGKSVYYRLLLPDIDYDIVTNRRVDRHEVLCRGPYATAEIAVVDNIDILAELTAKLEEYAQQIARLQAQLAEQTQHASVISNEATRSREIFTPEQDTLRFLNYARDDTTFINSQDYTAYKQVQEKQTRQPDILFNDKYEILLWDYLNKYKDNRFAEACYNHFAMLKNLYQHKGKKKLTEAGFHNIMNELEQLSGNDMPLKLAIMERSLRNNWAGFFVLPENTAEYKKAKQRKQGRKRIGCGAISAEKRASNAPLYRNQHSRSHYDSFQPREGRDLEYLVQ